MTAMSTVLIIGSAPDANRAADLDARNFDSIVVVNNAWRIRSDWSHTIYPDDFHQDRRPNPTSQQVVVTSCDYVPANNRFGGIVYAGATMAFTTAYWALAALKPNRMVFIGCDMIYDDEGETHFYGTGTADPLRDDPTLQSLEAKSNRLLILAKQNNCECLNLSSKPRSRLTFPRIDDAIVSVMGRSIIRQNNVDRALEMEREAGQYFPNGDYWNDTRPLNTDALRQIDEQWLQAVQLVS